MSDCRLLRLKVDAGHECEEFVYLWCAFRRKVGQIFVLTRMSISGSTLFFATRSGLGHGAKAFESADGVIQQILYASKDTLSKIEVAQCRWRNDGQGPMKEVKLLHCEAPEVLYDQFEHTDIHLEAFEPDKGKKVKGKKSPGPIPGGGGISGGGSLEDKMRAGMDALPTLANHMPKPIERSIPSRAAAGREVHEEANYVEVSGSSTESEFADRSEVGVEAIGQTIAEQPESKPDSTRPTGSGSASNGAGGVGSSTDGCSDHLIKGTWWLTRSTRDATCASCRTAVNKKCFRAVFHTTGGVDLDERPESYAFMHQRLQWKYFHIGTRCGMQ